MITGEFMIKPTVGRVVWFWPNSYQGVHSLDDKQPMAATVAFVRNDRCVNLSIVDHIGNKHSLTRVTLMQGDENFRPAGAYCEWMPYQVGQAKKDAPIVTSTTSKVGDVSHTETNVYGAATRSDLDAMVDRFLTWKLPADFAPDCGISFDGRNRDARGFPHQWPTGTNLLHAGQARAMLQHVLGGAPAQAGPKVTIKGSVSADAVLQSLSAAGFIRVEDAGDETLNVYAGSAPDTRPKQAPEAATTGETAADKQTAHQLPVSLSDVLSAAAPAQVADALAADPIEAEIQAKGLTAPRVTRADVESAIASEHYFTAANGVQDARRAEGFVADPLGPLPMVTLCVIVMRNGHKIVGVNTGSVSPTNFDAELARKLARQHAVDQIWPLLGYALRERLAAA